MDNQTAINVLEKYTDTTLSKSVIEAHNLGIEALKKQIPRKPVEQETDEKTHYKCECGYIMLTVYANGYRLGNQPKYCEKCGQKIDWSDEDE